MLALGAAMVTQALQAQTDSGPINNNDLVLGFTSQASGVSQDYILDLGQIPTTQNTQLGGISLSTFNTIFGSALGNGAVNVDIVGGNPSAGSLSVIESTLDNGSGTPNAPGNSPSTTFIADAADSIGAITLGAVAQTSLNSFSVNIASSPTATGTGANSFSGYLGGSTMATIGSSETITLDLFQDTQVGRSGTTGFTYEGDIALDLSGSTLSAVYDPVAVPEPSTYGLLAGAGLLAVAFRRQLVRKNA